MNNLGKLSINLSVNIICIILSVILTQIYCDLKSTSSLPEKFVIGKYFYISILENEVIDGDAIRSFRRNDHNELMCGMKEKLKLAIFMDNHNYKIRPGTYKLHQTYTYEEILASLLFVSK